MKTTSSERRLHPVSVVFEIGGRLPRLLVPLVLLLFATRSERVASIVFLVWLATIAAVVIVVSVASYLRFTYRYDAADLVIRSGLFTRNERRIPYARIQNLDAAQNPLHRLFGVTVVRVQTGGGAEPEASLILTRDAVAEMRARVLAAGGRAAGGHAAGARTADVEPDASPERAASPHSGTPIAPTSAAPIATTSPAPDAGVQPRTLLRLPPGELVLAGFIENRGMVLIAGALALLEQAGATRRLVERLAEGDGAIFNALAARWPGAADVPVLLGAVYIAAAVLVILLFIRLLSTVWAVVRLHDFRLERVGDELQMEYGLFTRVSATIPLRRVQTVIIRHGPLHRLFGRCAVVVETAAGVLVETGARPREPIAPILRLEQLQPLLQELQPGLRTDVITWRPVHPRAFGRMLRGSLFWPLALTLFAVPLVGRWAAAVLVVLLLGATVLARLRAGYLAWSLLPDSFVVRDGALMRETRVARFNRVQVVALDRNPFDLRTGMAGVRADTAGTRGGVVVPYLPADTAVALHGDLVARTAATAFVW
jgi:putative membrane protein